MPRAKAARGIPRLPLFYTLDQVAACLGLSEKVLRDSYIWMDGDESGAYHPRWLRAVNINPSPAYNRLADWRVAEAEFERWLRFHNLHLYDPDELIGTSERVAYEAAVHSARQHREFSWQPEPPHPNKEKPDDDLLGL